MKMRMYGVGVAKDYFPRELWPGGCSEFVETFQVRAASRMQAAQKIWEQHGERLLALMNPATLNVSLHVNCPLSGTSGRLGRLSPITVRRMPLPARTNQ